jgi:hypothetical protein
LGRRGASRTPVDKLTVDGGEKDAWPRREELRRPEDGREAGHPDRLAA